LLVERFEVKKEEKLKALYKELMQENYRTLTMKMNYNERLLYHQEHSLSIMLKYKEYIEGFKKTK
jgi:hypothetical protein